MAYATIMVHIDADMEMASTARIQVASGLAARFHSSLIGIASWAPPPPIVENGIFLNAELTEQDREEMIAQLKLLGEQFRSVVAKTNAHVEWRYEIDFPIDGVARAARAADLIIIGREQGARNMLRSLDPGKIVLRLGRPVLAVPDRVNSLEAKRIMIAWKDTRESRRAVQDSLPFLHEAERIFVAEVCEQGEEDYAHKGIDDVQRYLARHRISSDAAVLLHAKGAVAERLLRLVQDERIDLIVAGAYGHSRLGEWVFGGVTRDLLLTPNPVSCLFSH